MQHKASDIARCSHFFNRVIGIHITRNSNLSGIQAVRGMIGVKFITNPLGHRKAIFKKAKFFSIVYPS
ncbi:hypothetical protein D3C78_1535080 [compost metagenome]